MTTPCFLRPCLVRKMVHGAWRKRAWHRHCFLTLPASRSYGEVTLMHSTSAAQQMAVLSRVAADALQRRRAAGLALVDQAEAIARACHNMAQRFQQGGKLIAFGNGGSSTDAQHIAVEFVHPVMVGKRALPAISLTNDMATLTSLVQCYGWHDVFAYQLRYLAQPQDIAIAISQ